METSLSSELRTAILAESQEESVPGTEGLTKQEDMSFLTDSKDAEGLSGDKYSTKMEEFKVLSAEESHATYNQNILPKLNILDTSAVDKLDSAVNERNGGRSAVGLSLELEDVKENCQKLTKERNSLQQKLFEMQSEFCSVEIERDLEKETARYLEEQISSFNSSLLLKENEVVSLRKRYKLLNEGFLNSELLREGLERDVSGMTRIIRELEERLEASEGMLRDTERNMEVKTEEVSLRCGCADEKAKLESEILRLNGTLEKERNTKTSLEEMFGNLEKERALLLKEVEEMRNEHQKQSNEVNVLRDLLHDKNKQDQINQRQDQELQKRAQLKQQHQNIESSEVRESKVQLTHKISTLEDENKKLEGELYQQLAVLETLEVENKSFSEERKNLKEISDKLRVLGFKTVDQLAAEYSVLQEGKLELEIKITQLEHQISKEKMESHSGCGVANTCPHLGVNCTNVSCVPRSEYIKQKFQLKSLTDELNSLKQASRPKILNEKFVTPVTKQNSRSRKHDNKIAKKWLKTIKDSMSVVVKEDDDIATERCGNVLLENQLHETNMRTDELLYELEISKKENEVLVSTNRKREDEIEMLKRRLVESHESQNSLLREMKTKLQKAEKNLGDEIQRNVGNVEKIVSLEEQNQEICIEFEKRKEKFQCLQKEKDKIENELDSLKRDILKNFGSQSIQYVSKSLTSAKEKSAEYVKIIESNQNNLVRLTQDLHSLQQVNTVLREELTETRFQLEKKAEVISRMYLNEEISEKRQADRLQDVIQALESSKQNENELLAMYTNEKREWEKLQGELMSLHSELQETKTLLSEKEKECERISRIMGELEATCGVYEEEFEKSTVLHENEALDQETKENGLSSDENQEDALSDSSSESTAENFREIQELLQERMAMKIKRLQNRLEETLTAVSSCQKLNVNLQKKLHEAEKKVLEQEKVDGMTPDKEFLETILNKLSEKEDEIQEILQRNSSDSARANKDILNEDYMKNEEITSHYKEVIKQLKIDHAKDEVRLVYANEKIAKLEEKLATCQYNQDGNSNEAEMVVSGDVFSEEDANNDPLEMNNCKNKTFADHTRILDCSYNFTESVNTTMTSNMTANEEGNPIAINVNLKEELDCMTAKYMNLKAAFEECLRRLKMSEVDDNENEVRTVGNLVNVVGTKFEKHESSDVIQKLVVPKFTQGFYSPLQGKKTETDEFDSGSQNLPKFENYQATRGPKGSSFSEMSCAVLESDSELDSIGPDRMVIELTLTESDMYFLDVAETSEEYFQERLGFEKEFGRLRAKIIELEKINSRITGEIHLVKQCSFKERTDSENNMRSLQELNVTMKAKLAAVEAENNSLMYRANEADASYLKAKQEMQKIKTSVLDEQQISDNTIKGFKDQENTMKKIMVELETEKEELEKKVKELQRKLQDCSQETQRVKTESYDREKNYKSEFERAIEVHKKENECYAVKISQLKQQVCFREEEIRKSKICVQEEKLEHEELVTKLNDVILNLEKKNEDLKCEKSDAFEETLTQLRDKIVILEKEIGYLTVEKVSSVSVVRELEDKIDTLNEERQRSVKSLLNEKLGLENTTKELQITITNLRETFIFENMEKDKMISLLQQEKKTLLDERKQHGRSKEQFEDKILVLKKKIEDTKFEKGILETKINGLENRISSYREENSQEKISWLDDKKKLETTIKQLQFTMEEKMKQEKLEKEITISELRKTISTTELENESFKIENKKLESRVLRCVDEIQRIKSSSFNERQKLEADIKNLEETAVCVKMTVTEDEQEIKRLDLLRNDFVNKCFFLQEELERVKKCCFQERQILTDKIEELTESYSSMGETFDNIKTEKDDLVSKETELEGIILSLQEELQRVKKCSFQERQILTDKIEELTESYSSIGETFDNIKTEKDDLVSKETELAGIILSLQEELQRIKVCAFVERQILMAEDENYSTLVEESKTNFEYQILERDREISSLKLTVGELSDLRNVLENDKQTQQEEIRALGISKENLQNEKKSLETNVFNYEQQITALRKDLSDLKEGERSLKTEALERDEELFSVKKVVDQLQGEKKQLQDEIVERGEQMSLLELNVSKLEKQCITLQTDVLQQAQEKSAIQVTAENLEKENKSFEDDIVKCNSKISQLQRNLSRLEEEREFLSNSITMKDEQLSIMKLAVDKLQYEKKAVEENSINLDKEIVLLQTTLYQLRDEKDSITNDIGKRNKELSACKEIIEKFEAQKNVLEDSILEREREILLLKEIVSKLEEEKESFANDTINKDEKLTAFDIAVETFKSEKKTFEEDIKKRCDEILSLESMLTHVQNEKESFMNDVAKQHEELSVFKITFEKLQREKTVLEEDIVKQDGDISILEENVARLENEKQTLAHEVAEKNEEVSHNKIKFENLQKENNFLEDSLLKNDSEILDLKDKIFKHEEEKESLSSNIVKQEEELSTLRINVEELQNGKKAFEDEISKLNTTISSLESKVSNLQEEKEALTNDLAEKDEQLSAFAKNIKNLEAVKEFLESKVADNNDEIISLKDNVDHLKQVKKSFEVDIRKQEEELLSIKETLRNLQGEKKVLEKDKVELDDKLSHYTVKMERYQEDIEFLRNDLRKVTIEKESVENKIKQINEKTKCDEEDFDKLVAGYLQEIDSWKKGFGTLEEETNILRNETERLQDEKQDLENIVKDMRESKRESDGNFHENIQIYHEEIDSWKGKVQNIERDAEILRKTVQELESECERQKLEVVKINNEKEKNSQLYQETVTKFRKQKENSEKRWVLEKEKMGNNRIELETRLQTVESQFQAKEKELHNRNDSIEQFKDEKHQFTKVISEKNEEILNIKTKLRELEGTKLESDNRIHELQQQYAGKESELKHSVVRLEELEKETRKLAAIISEKEERYFILENEVKELTRLNKEEEKNRLGLCEQQEKSENELRNLRDMLKSFQAKELAEKEKLNQMEGEVSRLRSEMSVVEQRNSKNRNSEKSIGSNIEKSREQLRVLLADIDETSKIKISLEEEVQVLKSEAEQQSEEKTKLEMDVFCLKEITHELTKGKLTLLEEIARLSDQKKEGQELLNSEFSRLRVTNKELQNDNEKIQKENSEFIIQISSLKVTLATVQNAYEQTQDEIKNCKMRLEELSRRENQNNNEQEQLKEESKKLKMKITYLEETNRSINIEKEELSSSLGETRERLESLEKEFQTTKSENILLVDRLKQQGSGNDENSESGKPSTQVSNLRKKLKEFRTKLGEEKKQRELHEFEIKNLKEKVERFAKNEKEMETQLEGNRKKLLEVKTERDGLLMDLDSVNKRKKKDMEGYTSRIETLEDELRILKGRESKKADGKQTKETVNVLNEEKKILELKLTSVQERHQREVTELKTTLDSLQSRYTTELKRFEETDTANQNEILNLKKSLTTVEGELESQGRELDKVRANLVVVSNDKEKIEKVLIEKNSELNKWKKEASSDKAEIKFLRGSLNILEKEGFTNKPPETHDRVTNE